MILIANEKRTTGEVEETLLGVMVADLEIDLLVRVFG